MELSFVASAIRRYFYVVVACALLGAVPGFLGGGSDVRYESTGVLMLVPPASFGGDPERYVTGQMSVLASDEMASRVVEQVGQGTSVDSVSDAATFIHEPRSDIIRVNVDATDPAMAQSIANAYMVSYIGALEERATNALAPIDDQIATVREQIEAVDEQITAAMAPFVNVQAAPGEFYPPIPGVDQVAPALVSQKEILLTQFDDLVTSRTEIQVGSQFSASGQVTQQAPLPTQPLPAGSRLSTVIGFIGGAFLGSLIAVLWARLSTRVLDDLHAGDILGTPIVGQVPRVKGNLSQMFDRTPAPLMAFVDTLSVRIEAAAKRSDKVTVVVVGSQEHLGTTTLAAALAGLFARHGADTLLVDADLRHPRLSTMFADAIDASPTGTDQLPVPIGRRGPGLLDRVAPTPVDNLRVAAVGALLDGQVVRRHQVADVVDGAAASADSSVFDGGPLMRTAVTVELARLCDAVVLVMPKSQDARQLSLIADQLRDRAVFPVWAAQRVARRQNKKRRGSSRSPAARPVTPDANAAAPGQPIHDGVTTDTPSDEVAAVVTDDNRVDEVGDDADRDELAVAAPTGPPQALRHGSTPGASGQRRR